MKRGVLIGGLLCLALIGAALVAVFLQPIVVQGAAVTRGDLVKTESLSGQFIPHIRHNVVSTKSGIVGRVAIAEGETISAGDTVITLSADELTEELNAVETALRNLENSSRPVTAGRNPEQEAAQEALSIALANVENAKNLAQTVGVEYALLNEAISTFIEASSRAVFATGTSAPVSQNNTTAVNEDERQRLLGWKEELTARLAALDVISTVSGNVLWVNVEAGAEVKEGDVLAVAGNANGGMITAIDTTGRVFANDDVTLICNGLNWKGQVMQKDGNVLYIKPETGFMANGDITVVATLQSALDVCLLPVECLGEDLTGEYVLILNDEGVLERREVTTSMEQGGMVAVTSGIGIGETAVYYPDRYSEGMRAELYG
jgi:multidrug efflux pump subunit AcrA (membrane-fusion protein)